MTTSHYGLQPNAKNLVVKASAPGLQLKKPPSKPAVAAKPLAKPLSIFSSAMDDDEEEMADARAKTNKQIREHQQAKEKLMAKERLATLEEDPNAFEYDSMFDEIQNERASAAAERQQTKAKREARYIQQLLDKGADRETEQGIIYERVLRREREKEDHMYMDKDKFVTEGYKEKLITDKRWEEKEAIRVKKEVDVNKTGSMHGFSAFLLNSGASSRSNTSSSLKKEQEAVVKAEAEADAAKLDEIATAEEADRLKRAAQAETKRKQREEQHLQERIEQLAKERNLKLPALAKAVAPAAKPVTVQLLRSTASDLSP